MTDASGMTKSRWMIRCPVCGRTGDARRHGILRLGAKSLCKSTLGFCRKCRRPRRLELFESKGEVVDHPQRDKTWRELAAYVAMGTMDATTAADIHSTPAPEARKREVAAYVAEGMIGADQALTLLMVAEPEPQGSV